MQATSMEHIGRSGTGGLDPDQPAGHDTGQESLSKTFARNFPVYGRIADGWLLSSDFRPNDELLELRWVWQAAKTWQLDARARRREAVDLRAAPPAPRRRPLRSEEHTSELQSIMRLSYSDLCLKKKNMMESRIITPI